MLFSRYCLVNTITAESARALNFHFQLLVSLQSLLIIVFVEFQTCDLQRLVRMREEAPCRLNTKRPQRLAAPVERLSGAFLGMSGAVIDAWILPRLFLSASISPTTNSNRTVPLTDGSTENLCATYCYRSRCFFLLQRNKTTTTNLTQETDLLISVLSTR